MRIVRRIHPRITNSYDTKYACFTSRNLTDKFALAGDGVYAISQTGSIQLVDLKTNITTDLVQLNDVRRVSSNIHLFSVRVAEEHG